MRHWKFIIVASYLLLNHASAVQPGRQQQLTGDSQQCQAMFESRREMTAAEAAAVSKRLSTSQPFCPALLWTYTGTGNTMTRMLIEVASGFYTGSVYTDLSLVDILPGEYLCGPSVIAVKAHPQWHPFSSIRPDGIRPAVPHEPPDAKDICSCHFTRAVAVIRDPYATFLAEYKRLRTHDYSTCSLTQVDGKQCTGGHVSVINKNDFNATDFRHEAIRMAHEWSDMFDSYNQFQETHPQGLYLTTFENLTSPDSRMAALAGLLVALGVPPRIDTSKKAADSHNMRQKEELPSQYHGVAADLNSNAQRAASGGPAYQHLYGYDPFHLACAFDMAKHPQVFRSKHPASVDAEYVYASDTQLVCDLWQVVGSKAKEHGYAPYGHADCSVAV